MEKPGPVRQVALPHCLQSLTCGIYIKNGSISEIESNTEKIKVEEIWWKEASEQISHLQGPYPIESKIRFQ